MYIYVYIQGGREISAILLTVVGDGCTIWDLNLIVSLEKGVSCLFCSCHTAYIVRDNAKKFTSVGLSYKDVNILHIRCSLRKIK